MKCKEFLHFGCFLSRDKCIMEQNASRQGGGNTMKRTKDLTKGNVIKVMLGFFFPI